MLADRRFALRSLAKARGFTFAVVLTLGLGIGANTAIFSVVRGVLLRPLPHRDGDRLVYLRQSVEGPGGENVLFSVPEILDFRENAKSLGGIAEYSGMVFTLQGDEDAVRMTVGLVTGNYFQVMGLSPVLGRVLSDDDDGTGVPPVIVLTHEYWMNRFHGDSGIVGQTIRIDGQAVAAGEPMPRAEFRTASPEYFRAAGIPLLKGREFTSTDMEGSGLVVILNETLAQRLFPDQDPIGQRVAWTGDVLRFIPVSGDWRTVIGVVGDTKDGGLDVEAYPALFQPFAQEQVFSGGLVIRADRDAAGLAPAATRMVRSIAPQDPIENVLTVAEIKDQSVAPRRLNASLVGAFGILAVIIAAVGIAGVLAFSVSARTNEIGIRMSLGADAGRVQRMVIGEGGILLVIGLVLGVIGALFATRVIQGLLFGVAPHDPMTLGAVALVMLAVGIGACWLPARRAARVDPAVAMRGQ